MIRACFYDITEDIAVFDEGLRFIRGPYHRWSRGEARLAHKPLVHRHRPIRVDLRGVPYNIVSGPPGDADGVCRAPASDDPQIRIRATLRDEELMRVLIHEMMHACLWDLSEEAVDETSADVATALYGMGYRLVSD